MSETIDEISVAYEEEGQLLVKELDKEVLTRGSWTTIVFKYCDFDRKKGDFGPAKVSIRRYRKFKGRYQMQSKFNISSATQSKQLVDVLTRWFADMPVADAAEEVGAEE